MVLRIEESITNIDRVAFISAVNTVSQNLQESCVSVTDRVTGILALNGSNTTIIQSRFEGNDVGLGTVIHDTGDNHVTIINTTFLNNGASYQI